MRKYSCIQVSARSEYCCKCPAGIRDEAIADGPPGVAAADATIRFTKAGITSPVANANLTKINTCLRVMALLFSAMRRFNQFESCKSAPSVLRSFYIRFAKITVRKPLQT